jgi:hypothetical protein
LLDVGSACRAFRGDRESTDVASFERVRQMAAGRKTRALLPPRYLISPPKALESAHSADSDYEEDWFNSVL